MARWLWILLLTTAASGAELGFDPKQMFAAFRAKVLQQAAHAVNFTCVEKLRRFTFQYDSLPKAGCDAPVKDPDRKTMIIEDRLRLDVAVGESKEVFGWHGQPNTATENINQLIRSGPMQTGGFTGLLRILFGTTGVTFHYLGATTETGAPTYKFDYTVPRARGGYQVQTRSGGWTVVGFHGFFFVSAVTKELVELDVKMDDLQPETKICTSATTLRYQLTPIGEQTLLLPEEVTTSDELFTHALTSTRGTYEACREFRGESTLRFDDAGAVAAEVNAKESSQPFALPKGKSLVIGPREPIAAKEVYTGDHVEFTTRTHLRLKEEGLDIPKGALVSGVVNQFERHLDSRSYVVQFHFDHLSFGNQSLAISARAKLVAEAGSGSPAFQGGRRGQLRAMSPPVAPDDGAIVLRGDSLTISPKQEFELVNEAPAGVPGK